MDRIEKEIRDRYKQNIGICLLLFLSVFFFSCKAQGVSKTFSIKTGDLLFQEHKPDSSISSAVVAATRSIDQYHFSHVGVAFRDKDSIYVFEAVSSGVRETPLHEFLAKSATENHVPVVVVGRVKKKYSEAIAYAIPQIKTLIGKPYDNEFLPDNDKYYCSELVYETFRINGKPIFKASPMSFKDLRTGKISPLWKAFFKKIGKPIPEGVLGTNPGDMSKSKEINILGLVPDKYLY
ncbi:MAG: hypothetical protein M0P00_06615 [Bacteroidaceae bacterium]|nr:hypothetical protein [Bacteroidaceae bacterium]